MKRHTITCPHHDLTITPEGTTCDSCGEGIDLVNRRRRKLLTLHL
jgi:hypothetical protein